jgi:predicted Zn-dependent protease
MNRRHFLCRAARLSALGPLALAGLPGALGVLASGVLSGCAHAPYTGRNQLMLVGAQQELSLGAQAAKEVLDKEKPCANPVYKSAVKEVGERIARAANQPDYDWEFYCVDKPDTVNAFCLPGGKIFVYSGLFKVARNRTELAVVVGHEAAHAIARHAAERMSVSLLTQLGERAALSAVGAAAPAPNRGGQFSREQEYEADHVGLILTAKAGYDPRAAIAFWSRMAEESAKKGTKPPEYVSTHPSDEKRIQALRELMPEALRHYRRS